MTEAELRAVVGDNIRRQAERRRIALNHVADRADVSRSQLFDVLSGKKAPTTDWLLKVADALETEPWRLLKPPPG